MQIVFKNLFRETLFSILGILLLLILLFAFFKFLDEFDNIGTKNFNIQALIIYIAYLLPYILYTVSSFSVLIGMILSVGNMVNTKELMILESSGVSKGILIKKIILLSLFYLSVSLSFGEFIAIDFLKKAENFKSVMLGKNIGNTLNKNIWVKQENNVILINLDKQTNLPGFANIFELTEDNKLKSIHSTSIKNEAGNSFRFAKSKGLEIIEKNNRFSIAKIDSRSDKHKNIEYLPKKLDSGTSTIIQLAKNVYNNSINGISSKKYQIEILQRIITPLNICIMILIAIPSLFNYSREFSLGKRLFFGISFGILAILVSKYTNLISLRFETNIFLVFFLPSVLFFLVGYLNYYKTIRYGNS